MAKAVKFGDNNDFGISHHAFLYLTIMIKHDDTIFRVPTFKSPAHFQYSIGITVFLVTINQTVTFGIKWSGIRCSGYVKSMIGFLKPKDKKACITNIKFAIYHSPISKNA